MPKKNKKSNKKSGPTNSTTKKREQNKDTKKNELVQLQDSLSSFFTPSSSRRLRLAPVPQPENVEDSDDSTRLFPKPSTITEKYVDHGSERPAKRERRRSLDWTNRSLPNITLETPSVVHSESAEADEASGSCQTPVLCKKGRFSTLKTAECLRKQFEKFNKTSLDDLPKKRTVAVKPGKKRGRKSKAELAALSALASAAQSAENLKPEEPSRSKNDVDQSPSVIDGNKRKRGRPKKKPVVESDSDPVCNDDDLDVNAYRRFSEASVNSETNQSASNINPISDSQICLQCSDSNAQILDSIRPFLQQLDRKITFATDFMQQQCRKINEICDKFNSVGADELIVPHKC